jgi:hypothetical protein
MTDAPLPVKKTFSCLSNKNENFNLEIYIENNEFLLIKAILNNEKNNLCKYYENKFNINNIKKNQYFQICESIYDIFLTINSMIDNNDKEKPFINESDNENEIILTIPVPHILIKKAEFRLIERTIVIKDLNNLYQTVETLTEKIRNQENIIQQQNIQIQNLEKKIEKINKLEEIINQQNLKIEFLQEKNQNINTLKPPINDNNSIIDELKKKIIQLEEIIKEQNIKIQKLYDDKEEINSLTVISNIFPKDKEKEKQLRNWIDMNNEIQFDLIFRMSRDGEESKDFHNKCDNKGCTLILIETMKGYIFGGYTPLKWDDNGFKNDDETFVFSINKMEKVNKLNKQINVYSINSVLKRGPVFGNGDIVIFENMKKGKLFCTNLSCFLSNYRFTEGEQDFEVKEIEVFQVKKK